MKRPYDYLLRPKFSKLYRLPFSRYSSFKFWSRDYHVIMTSQKFFIWLRKCPFSQPFIWGAAIGRTCVGSRDIWLLNFDHVTTWSRDFSKNFKAFPGMCPMAPYQICNVKWPYLLWFSHNKAPQYYLSYHHHHSTNHGKFHSFTVIKRKITELQKLLWGLIFIRPTTVPSLETKF